ncbi:MAG: hypothetical protein SGI83_05790 [Bacteroidota bacterium]|nr:hypothetical protein [Bacteroidota bacterium]
MKHLFFTALIALSICSFAQVGISPPTPKSKATLDVTFTMQVFLPPL